MVEDLRPRPGERSRQLLADGFIAKLDKRLQELWVIKLKAKLTIL